MTYGPLLWYTYDDLHSFWSLKKINSHLLQLHGKNIYIKSSLCFTEERKSYEFGKTWGVSKRWQKLHIWMKYFFLSLHPGMWLRVYRGTRWSWSRPLGSLHGSAHVSEKHRSGRPERLLCLSQPFHMGRQRGLNLLPNTRSVNNTVASHQTTVRNCAPIYYQWVYF